MEQKKSDRLTQRLARDSSHPLASVLGAVKLSGPILVHVTFIKAIQRKLSFQCYCVFMRDFIYQSSVYYTLAAKKLD